MYFLIHYIAICGNAFIVSHQIAEDGSHYGGALVGLSDALEWEAQ